MTLVIEIHVSSPEIARAVISRLEAWLSRFGLRVASWQVVPDPDGTEERGPAVGA